MTEGLVRTFKWPLVLGALTAVGLVSALVADGVWDALSWAGLAVPVATGSVALSRTLP